MDERADTTNQTHHALSVLPATDEDIPGIIDLMLKQDQWHQTLDKRLHKRLRNHLEATVVQAMRADERPLVAHDGQGRVRGYIEPDVWELSHHSTLLAFLTRRNGIAKRLTLPSPQEDDAHAVATALLTALSRYWHKQGTTGDLVRWPSCDGWLTSLLFAQGFVLDSVCALRPSLESLPSEFDRPPSFAIRQARPQDEETLVDLFREELLAHERCVPCARVSPAALRGFRAKLHHLWQGEPVEEGAPLVLVAEQERGVVAMAETTLLMLTPNDDPGFTPPGRYGCIDNVCVREHVRGQGIGQGLVQTIATAFAELPLDLEGWLLWYNPDNVQAARFWNLMGFQPLWTTYQRLHQTNTIVKAVTHHP